MNIPSVGTIYTPSQTNQVTNPYAQFQKPANAAVKSPTDADGDHDGDTTASDAKGLDVTG